MRGLGLAGDATRCRGAAACLPRLELVIVGSVMTPPQVPVPTEPHVLNLDWLVRLRFGSLLGQVATVLFVACVLQMPLPLVELGPFRNEDFGAFASRWGLAAMRRRWCGCALGARAVVGRWGC